MVTPRCACSPVGQRPPTRPASCHPQQRYPRQHQPRPRRRALAGHTLGCWSTDALASCGALDQVLTAATCWTRDQPAVAEPQPFAATRPMLPRGPSAPAHPTTHCPCPAVSPTPATATPLLRGAGARRRECLCALSARAACALSPDTCTPCRAACSPACAHVHTRLRSTPACGGPRTLQDLLARERWPRAQCKPHSFLYSSGSIRGARTNPGLKQQAAGGRRTGIGGCGGCVCGALGSPGVRLQFADRVPHCLTAPIRQLLCLSNDRG